eukprot:CAMPEP_0118957224 /NCGR_PEP_ID=MMETSP1169-20130426/61984_1 /TAXON_ID=36882 /ORGANISM="Pyramimonas obovata, Strain CCMP722" /LENGTH=692 /DNA_ID=CAMNT_0006905279 /DNA_START=242 /DNA_END=2320 /DNA_ORIENTATION=-
MSRLLAQPRTAVTAQLNLKGRAALGKPALRCQGFTRPVRVRDVQRGTAVVKCVGTAASFASEASARLSADLSQTSPADRLKLLVSYGKKLAGLPEEEKTMANRVMGCTTQVWMTAKLDDNGNVEFAGDSDSDISRGMVALLTESLAGLKPEEIIEIPAEFLESFGLGGSVVTPSRANGMLNMFEAMKKSARLLTESGKGCSNLFPSLTITADSLTPQGAYAVAQAQYLEPDSAAVDRLVEVLTEKKIGIVAHFYMDPEVQGVLSAAAKRWPHIAISDSLVMADKAVNMAKAGCQSVAVLGVDFMTENVRAVMDGAGLADVGVYRMATDKIGCSLAEAAEGELYTNYLREAGANQGSNLHVIYINTSLRTKAAGNDLVPTITCTSSNVVNTVLQAAAQVPGVNIWYGPDTYMGGNLAELFQRVVQLGDEEIAKLHPEHNTQTIQSLLPRLRYFQDGTCIVHHLFGGEVCAAVRAGYSDAYQTAHFEVPGEMFQLAMEARERGMGTVGSTSNILDFIAARVQESLALDYKSNLRFVLGTESGMITSIVNKVQDMLRDAGDSNPGVSVEVVFPVSLDAISTEGTLGAAPGALGGLAVVPGPAAGEGCSTSGGCASCPYMKMNSLAALQTVCDLVSTPEGEAALKAFEPEKYSELDPAGRTVAERGVIPITHMRHFQQTGSLSPELVDDITSRNPL